MFTRLNRLGKFINKHSFRYISIDARTPNELIQRLEYITVVLKNKHRCDDEYTDKAKLDEYYTNLKNEKHKIFKIMTLNGRWDEYMEITKEFTGHTYS